VKFLVIAARYHLSTPAGAASSAPARSATIRSAQLFFDRTVRGFTIPAFITR